MSTPILRLQNVEKSFGKNHVLRGVDLEVQPGESVVIIGGSGSGKSVMLKNALGLMTPDSGRIFFNGKDVTKARGAARNNMRDRVGMLFQAGALFDSISVEENVAYGLEEHFRYKMSKKEISERVEWALGLVGLPGIQQMWPADLSGGMRKRVALARAIAVRPEVLLYDEPTTGLDPINTARVNHLIMGLQEQLHITSVVVTHDMKSAFTISDRIAMVHSGRIICEGTVDEFQASQDPRVSDFIEGRAPVKESVETLLVSG